MFPRVPPVNCASTRLIRVKRAASVKEDGPEGKRPLSLTCALAHAFVLFVLHVSSLLAVCARLHPEDKVSSTGRCISTANGCSLPTVLLLLLRY